MFIKDVIKFVQNFAGVIDKSTPHLYLSALPFSPSNSVMANGLVKKFAGIAQVAVGQHHDWPRNEHVLQGHTAGVLSVAFSPDGRHIVSGSSDKTIRVWDAQTGDQVGNPLQGHTDWIRSVAFSPDGRHIVSGSSDKTIRVWDAQTGGKVGNPLQGHTGLVRSVAFSPDGRHIVSGSSDKTIRVWDAQPGGQVATPLQGHLGGLVRSVAFSPDGMHIVSGSHDNAIQVWDAQTASQLCDKEPSTKFSLINFSSSNAYALQHVQSLFINVPPDTGRDCRDLIHFQNDGWIVGPNKQLLLWIHPSYHPSFCYTLWTNLVIPKGYVELDLSKMRHGPTWHMCYSSQVGMAS